MARNRYVKDYRLLETVDERGRIKSSYEYIGDAYRFVSRGERLKKAKLLALGLCPLLWLLFIGAMLPRSLAMRTFYVSLPFAFSALPLGITTEILVSTCLAKEPLEHRHADKIGNRLPPAALSAAVLMGVSLIGEIVRLLLGGAAQTGDAVFSLLAALLLGGCVIAFRLRRALVVRKE